jgi:hypothetical protein
MLKGLNFEDSQMMMLKICSCKVNWPIVDCLPMIEYLFISSSYVLHFE